MTNPFYTATNPPHLVTNPFYTVTNPSHPVANPFEELTQTELATITGSDISTASR